MLNDGILSIDETEGEEISLTAEGPQLTEEERERATGHPHVHEGGKYTTKEKVLTKIIIYSKLKM